MQVNAARAQSSTLQAGFSEGVPGRTWHDMSGMSNIGFEAAKLLSDTIT